jgi:hypothetical protein
MIMRGVPRRAGRQLGALFLLALLVCGLPVSGHSHHSGDLGTGGTGCAVCAARFHGPAISPSALPVFVLLQQGEVSNPPGAVQPAPAETGTRGPRAPPASSTLVA